MSLQISNPTVKWTSILGGSDPSLDLLCLILTGLVEETQGKGVWGGGEGWGEVIHGSNGSWVLGFAKACPWATNNQMELIALHEGPRLVEENNLTPIEICIDSTEFLS